MAIRMAFVASGLLALVGLGIAACDDKSGGAARTPGFEPGGAVSEWGSSGHRLEGSVATQRVELGGGGFHFSGTIGGGQ